MAKILVIRLAAIADVAMTLPVIYSAAKANPQDSFTVLTQAFMMPVFMNRPSNLEVIGISTKGAEKTLIGLLRFTSALVKFDYDVVLDLNDVIRTMIIRTLFWVKGKPVYVLDKIRKRYPPLMRKENKKMEPLPTVIERYADVFRAAGLAYTESFTSLYESRPADLSKMEAIAGAKTGKWLGIAPFARYRGKVYPIDEMEQVVAGRYNAVSVRGERIRRSDTGRMGISLPACEECGREIYARQRIGVNKSVRLAVEHGFG